MVTFKQMSERVRRACQDRESMANGLRRWRSGLSETKLYDAALQAGAAAAALLPIAWCLAAHRVAPPLNAKPPKPRKVTLIGDFFQIGLGAVVLPKIDEFIRDKRTYRDVMAELIMRTVQQHVRVAWQRFATPQGKDVSVLVADLETWSRNNAFSAGRTDLRLWVAIGWLEQLGLVDKSGILTRGSAF